jgi:hypothetical protein
VAQQLAIFRGMEKPRREAGAMQRGPEAVARTRKVKPRGGRIETGVDAAEEDGEVRREDIAQPLAARPVEIGGARPA